MVNILNKNIKNLDKYDDCAARIIFSSPNSENLKLLQAKNKEITGKLFFKYISSSINPSISAKKIADKMPGNIVLIGIGMGYLAKALGDKLISVIEVDSKICKTLFKSLDFSNLLAKKKLILSDNLQLISKRLYKNKTDLNFVIHPYYNNFILDKNNKEFIERYLKLYSKLDKYFKAYKNIKKRKLKILIVGPVYGGSLSIFPNISESLKDLGHFVDTLDFSKFNNLKAFSEKITTIKKTKNIIKDMFVEYLSHLVLAKVQNGKYDLILALSQAPLTPDVLKEINSTGVVTVFWFIENFREIHYWKMICPFYKYIFTFESDKATEAFKKHGANNVFYLPLAANIKQYKEIIPSIADKDKYYSDISFAGSYYYNREIIFSGLLNYNFTIFGGSWPGNSSLINNVKFNCKWLKNSDFIKIYNLSNININLHSSNYFNGINPEGESLNPRVFEIGSCHGFQLVDKRKLLRTHFSEDEIPSYSDINELKEKIDYFLENPIERNRFAENAYKRILREHTYIDRMENMLSCIELSNGFDKLQERETWDDLKDILGEENIKNKICENSPPNIDNIKNLILSLEGELTRDEKILLTIYEIKNWAKRKGIDEI